MFAYLSSMPRAGHQIFRQYFMKETIVGKKKSLRMKRVLGFSLQILFEIFLILRRIQRNIVINVKTSSCAVPLFCRILVKLEFSRQIFGKNLRYQILSRFVKWESSTRTAMNGVGQCDTFLCKNA